MTDWSDSLIEDYLNILDSLFSLAETLNINTKYQDKSIIFSKNDILVEDNPDFTWDDVLKKINVNGTITGKNRAKQYFLGGF